MAHLLLIDDDEILTHLLAERLEREGHQVETAPSAEAALAAIAQTDPPFEILLVDNRLGPGMSGIEFLRQVKQEHPDLDAILFTGLDEPGVGLEAYRAGAYRYITKPFQPQELLLIIQSLLDWRTAHRERDWLYILNEIVAELQGVETVAEVGRALVEGGLRLGFDRARFYTAHERNGQIFLQGVCQAGAAQVLGFEQIHIPLAETTYSVRAVERREPTFFSDYEHEPGFLVNYLTTEGDPPLVYGDWVSVPLFSGEQCIGVLNLDNCQRPRPVPEEQRKLVRLFAGQAALALERARRQEEGRRSHLLDEMVQNILNEMGDPAQPGSLDRLLLALRDAFSRHPTAPIEVRNFLVALQGHAPGWFYNRLHLEDGQPQRPFWRSTARRRGMIWCLLTQGKSLYYPRGTEDHRRRYGLELVGERAARSWMGVPLRIGDQIVGAMAMEDDHQENVFQPEHFQLLCGLAERLAGVIETAWLNEQQRETNRLLGNLQQASETIIDLARRREDWLWHATLTLCTAHYGAQFDRAMLFLVEPDPETGDQLLRGRMAIGHLDQDAARRDWERDVDQGMDWNMYLERLQADELPWTPLHEAVCSTSIPMAQAGGAFAEILAQRKPITVKEEEADERLPVDFLDRFGRTEYLLVPVNADEHILGVVVLDNIWGTDPQHYAAIPYLDALTNHAALVYEMLRHDRALEQLVDVQREVLVQAVHRPLRETLERICETARALLQADLAAIYPLHEDPAVLRYDHQHTGRAGNRRLSGGPIHSEPTGLSKYALFDAREPIVIPDVEADTTLYYDERPGAAKAVWGEGIRATIAAPVLGLRTGRPRAMFYIDYRTPRNFSEPEVKIVKALAGLAATAISNWRAAQGLRDAQEAREAELRQLSGVLERALESQVTEREIVDLLLDRVPVLFAPLEVTTGITLKEWQREGPNNEPVAYHRYLYPAQSGLKERRVRASEDKGLNCRAMQTGQVQRVGNVLENKYYRRRSPLTRSELDVPISLDGQVIGALNVESPVEDGFTPHHEEMAQRFVRIASLALGNLRRQENLHTVLQVASAVTGPASLEETLAQLAAEVQQAVPELSTLVIWYQDPETKELKLGSHFGVRNVESMLARPPRRGGAVGQGFKRKKPAWFADVTQVKYLCESKFVQKEGIRSTAIFPLRWHDEAIGVLFFSYREPHVFTDEERRLYPILAEVVAASVHDALLLYRAERERRRFELALGVADAIGAALDREEVIERVLDHIREGGFFPHTRAAVLAYDQEETQLIVTPASYPFYYPEDPANPKVQAVSLNGQSIVALAARRTLKRREKVAINEGQVRSHPAYLLVHDDTQSELAVTLWSQERGLMGALILESSQANAFDKEAEETAVLVAKQIRMAMERALDRDDLERNTAVAVATAWASEIAHDIGQEIYHIRSAVDALRENRISSQPEQRNIYLDRIDESARQLITATPPESQKPQPIDLNDYLRSTVERLVRELDAKIELVFQGGCADLEVTTYPYALERILRHLVRNARQELVGQEQKVIRVETEHLERDGQVEIRFSDNGPGIPPELRRHVFHRRLPRRANGHGGLGLLLVSFLVEQIGGSIRLLDSAEGAAFAIRIPEHLPTNDEHDTEPEANHG